MSNVLDYPLASSVVADRPDQLKALGDPLRSHILDLVLERAMSVTDLAATLGKPKGTVAHHVEVLVDAGLLAVVRTRQVRAVTERFYGRTGRTIVMKRQGDDAGVDGEPLPFVREAEQEVDRELWEQLGASTFTLRHARIPLGRAAEFAGRAMALAVEFTELPREGDVEFGFLVGLYPTTRRTARPVEPIPAALAPPGAPVTTRTAPTPVVGAQTPSTKAKKAKKPKKAKVKHPKPTGLPDDPGPG